MSWEKPSRAQRLEPRDKQLNFPLLFQTWIKSGFDLFIFWFANLNVDQITRPSNCPRSVCGCHFATEKLPKGCWALKTPRRKQKVSEMSFNKAGGQPSRRISRFDDIFQLTIIYVVSKIWIHARSLFCPSDCLSGDRWMVDLNRVPKNLELIGSRASAAAAWVVISRRVFKLNIFLYFHPRTGREGDSLAFKKTKL